MRVLDLPSGRLLLRAADVSPSSFLPPQDELPGRHLPDAGLDDVEVHQLPAEEVAGAQSEPGAEEEDGQPQEQTSQTGPGKR